MATQSAAAALLRECQRALGQLQGDTPQEPRGRAGEDPTGAGEVREETPGNRGPSCPPPEPHVLLSALFSSPGR